MVFPSPPKYVLLLSTFTMVSGGVFDFFLGTVLWKIGLTCHAWIEECRVYEWIWIWIHINPFYFVSPLPKCEPGFQHVSNNPGLCFECQKASFWDMMLHTLQLVKNQTYKWGMAYCWVYHIDGFSCNGGLNPHVCWLKDLECSLFFVV